MALTKYKLGELIKQRREKNKNYDVPVRGVSRHGFIDAKQERVDGGTAYNVFYLNDFVFNSARMEVNSIVFNNIFEKAICSPLYDIFYVTRTDILIPEYLNLFVKRDEFARRCEFMSFGSAHNSCKVEDLSNIEIDLPSMPEQKKAVTAYNAMRENQATYERGLEDLKLLCDAYIENLRRETPTERIEKHIERQDMRNRDNRIKNVKSVSVTKEFKDTGAKVNKEELQDYKVVKPRQISFVQTTGNEKVFAFAFNNTNENILVTSVNEVFSTNEKKLLPEYLAMWFKRTEFDRYARFHSWGSARETFTWTDLCEVKIPIPDIKIQQAIADIYNVYMMRREVNEKLKKQLKEICPILIRGSLKASA